MSQLNEKQKRFVKEYLVDLNATQAAIRAEYSQRTAYSMGQRLLKKVEIQVAIQKAIEAREKRTEITQDRVLEELARVAFANGSDFAKVVALKLPPDPITGTSHTIQTVELTPTDELPPEKRAAIAGIEETKNGIKVSSYDKVRALELLGKHLGMFDGKSGKPETENNLLDAIVDSAEGDMDTDDLPEIQQAAATGADVVE